MRILVLASLVGFLVLPGCSNPVWVTDSATTPGPPPGLVSWWEMDGSGKDVAGRNNASVSLSGSVPDRRGNPGGALGFDGRRSRFSVAQPDGLGFDLRTDSYSLALWVRSAERGGRARLVQQWSELNEPYAFSLQTDVTGLNAVVSDRPTTWIVRVPNLWDGAWHHVAVTYDAEARVLTSYRDGQVAERRTGVIIERSTKTNAPLTVGAAPLPVTNRHFAGSIDDLQIYARALSPSEIASLAR